MRTSKGTIDRSGRPARRLRPGLLGLVAGLASAGVAYAAAAPVVSHVSAKSGPTTGGNTVTITGKHFMTGGKGTVKKVLFGTKAATHVHVVSATRITVTAPSHAAGSVVVRVVAKSGTMSRKTTAARYTYLRPLPTIASLTPASGTTAGGTSVVIAGTDLAGATAVTFGGLPATFTVDSATQITATSPAYTATVNTTIFVMVLTAAGWCEPTMNDMYTYQVATPPTGAPTVTTITPASGAAGDTITITGTGFTGATTVDFDTTAATSFTVVSDTSITATVPAGVGTVDVMVTNSSGTSAMSTADWFTYDS